MANAATSSISGWEWVRLQKAGKIRRLIFVQIIRLRRGDTIASIRKVFVMGNRLPIKKCAAWFDCATISETNYFKVDILSRFHDIGLLERASVHCKRKIGLFCTGKKPEHNPELPEGLKRPSSAHCDETNPELANISDDSSNLVSNDASTDIQQHQEMHGASPLLGRKIATNSTAMNLCRAKFFLHKV